MYYVNHDQIERRLRFIPFIAQSAERLRNEWNPEDTLFHLAQERILLLAIETVTDVGSLLIDGFLMRDASSYEDIVEILSGEQVFSAELTNPLLQLVKLRKPMIQEYMSFKRDELHPLLPELPRILTAFAESVREFMKKELGE